MPTRVSGQKDKKLPNMWFSQHLFLVLLCVVGLVSVIGLHADVDEDEDDLDLDNADGFVADEAAPVVDSAPTVQEKIEYKTPSLSGRSLFFETFDNIDDASAKWIMSAAKKDGAEEAIAKYDGKWLFEEPKNSGRSGDIALVLSSKAKHHAIAAKMDEPYEFTSDTFIVQYDVTFQNGLNCGGAYVKLLSHDAKMSMTQFQDRTPYTIMFGPDKCGNDNKLHFIFRHKNPITGVYEEKHAKKPTASIDYLFTDDKSHLLTLVISSDNSFTIYVDQKVVNSGSLLEDMTPSVNPPREIVDTDDRKPADWDDREKIADPDATKPEDWDEAAPKQVADSSATKPDGWLDDEAELISDPEAEKPEDWDEDMDGEWEAPQISNPKCKEAPGCGEWKVPVIDNPKYKGKWRAPMIDNPNYKGKWTASKIANPDYFEDNEPWRMSPIGAVGLELWSMTEGITFDNFLLTDDKSVADDLAKNTWSLKLSTGSSSMSGKSVVDFLLEATEGRPWMWAVYVGVVVLPLLGLFSLLRPRSYPKEDAAAAKKKTDAPTADDVVAAAAADDAAAAAVVADDEGDEDEDEDEDADGEEEAAPEPTPEPEIKKKISKSSLESETKEDSDEEETSENNKPRSRKPRKE